VLFVEREKMSAGPQYRREPPGEEHALLSVVTALDCHFICMSLTRQTRVPVFSCSRVPVLSCSRVPVFPCSRVPVFPCSRVPVFPCSRVPVFSCSRVPVFPCSRAPV